MLRYNVFQSFVFLCLLDCVLLYQAGYLSRPIPEDHWQRLSASGLIFTFLSQFSQLATLLTELLIPLLQHHLDPTELLLRASLQE